MPRRNERAALSVKQTRLRQIAFATLVEQSALSSSRRNRTPPVGPPRRLSADVLSQHATWRAELETGV